MLSPPPAPSKPTFSTPCPQLRSDLCILSAFSVIHHPTSVIPTFLPSNDPAVGTVDAEFKVPSAENSELTTVLFVKLKVGQDMYSFACIAYRQKSEIPTFRFFSITLENDLPEI